MAAHAGPLSHRRRWVEGVVQAVSPPGVLDLGPGYLDPDLLPVDLLREAYGEALAEFGSAALSYGADQGALVLREALAARAAAADGSACGPEQVLVTAGTSHALHLLTTGLAVAGQVVFVERTSYDFARRIFTDHGLRVREVPADAGGMDPRALREAIDGERAGGSPPAFAYLTPTFHNPTGRLVGEARRRELLDVTAGRGVLVVEDDAYAELGLDGLPLPPSMAALAGYRGVIRLGTFSKTLAPGLRLGWLLAEAPVTARLAARGLFVSGGSANHLTSLAVATLLGSGRYDRHLEWLRSRLRERRDALSAAIRAHLGERVEADRPGGGFFHWLTFPGHREADVLRAADRAGVRVSAGSRFGGVDRSVRLAHSFTAPDLLATAVGALAAELSALTAHPTATPTSTAAIQPASRPTTRPATQPAAQPTGSRP